MYALVRIRLHSFGYEPARGVLTGRLKFKRRLKHGVWYGKQAEALLAAPKLYCHSLSLAGFP